MNSKKAKTLRKLVKNMKSHTDKIKTDHNFIETNNFKTLQYTDIDDNGNSIEKELKLATGTLRVDPTSEHGLYRHLKHSLEK